MNIRKFLLRTITLIMAIALILLAIIMIADWTLPMRTDSRIATAIKIDQATPITPPTEIETTQLPAPVDRLCEKLMADPRGPVRGIAVNLTGLLRLPGSDQWHEIEGRQYISALRPAFLWDVCMKTGPAWVEIIDQYQNGGGKILSKVFSLIPVLDEQNKPELSITQLVR